MDTAQIERDYQHLNERRAQDRQAASLRRMAVDARQAAQSFSDIGRALRKMAQTKGSPVEHLATLDVAVYAETMADVYAQAQHHYATDADRLGSL